MCARSKWDKKTCGILSGSKVIVADSNLKGQLYSKGYGEKEGNRLQLSLIEALHLVENSKIDVIDDQKPNQALTFNMLLEKARSMDDNFYSKYLVYRDLRDRGLLVKTGLKFGADFRVYERGVSIGTGHSHYLIHVVPEEYSCSFPELARAVRLSQSVNKDMIYAVVDEETDITYYRIERIKL